MLQVSGFGDQRKKLLIEHPMGWLMYIFGIMDYMSQKHGLTETKTIAIFTGFLYGKVKYPTETDAAATGIVLREIMECSCTEYGQELMKLGVMEIRTFTDTGKHPFKGLYAILESLDEKRKLFDN